MTSFTKCGKCIACTRFNGLNGSGYQPCHRPIPPYIEPPRIEYIGGEDPQDDSLSFNWCFWFFGICLGIAIGLQLAKHL